jgi:hypothetical protein
MKMNKELSMMTVLRLQTELEYAIEQREHFLKIDNFLMYEVWDQDVYDITNQIRRLGEQ